MGAVVKFPTLGSTGRYFRVADNRRPSARGNRIIEEGFGAPATRQALELIEVSLEGNVDWMNLCQLEPPIQSRKDGSPGSNGHRFMYINNQQFGFSNARPRAASIVEKQPTQVVDQYRK